MSRIVDAAPPLGKPFPPRAGHGGRSRRRPPKGRRVSRSRPQVAGLGSRGCRFVIVDSPDEKKQPTIEIALTRLARQRRCSEAELLREAVSRLAGEAEAPAPRPIASAAKDDESLGACAHSTSIIGVAKGARTPMGPTELTQERYVRCITDAAETLRRDGFFSAATAARYVRQARTHELAPGAQGGLP